jgi:AraC family transcriptional regulator
VQIEFIERQPVRVAYLRYTGPMGEPLGRFWRGPVATWLAELGLLDCPRFGVALDDPMSTPPEKCRYDACVEAPRGMTLPGAGETTIPGGRHAITRFKGTSAEIGVAWGAFIGAVLGDPANRRDSARHPFEHYPRGAVFDARTGVFACELLLPLAG